MLFFPVVRLDRQDFKQVCEDLRVGSSRERHTFRCVSNDGDVEYVLECTMERRSSHTTGIDQRTVNIEEQQFGG